MQSQVELCLSLATKAHAGQVDKAGAPYILHPLRVSESCKTEVQKSAALLHDVLEDTYLTAQDLTDAGVSKRVVQIVKLLTRNLGDDYIEYIRRIASDADVTAVKKADLRDSLDISRLSLVTERDELRCRKYREAYAILSE